MGVERTSTVNNQLSTVFLNYQPYFSTINRFSQLQIPWAENLMQNYLFPHEKLEAWQLAKELARKIYDLTSAFPSRERFGLVDQVRRAGVSVMSNLAEGSGRTSVRDQAHFSQIAYGSLLEVDAQLQLSSELGFLSEANYKQIRQAIHVLARKISALRSSQVERCSKGR
jgi:four helix bundle protein